MKLAKRNSKKKLLIARCENCGKEHKISYANTTNPHMASIDLKTVVQCECGEYHNLIIDHDNHRIIKSPTAQKPAETQEDIIKCPRCGSTQLHAGDKGFGLGKAAAGGIVLGPVGLLGGLIGSKKIIITCLKCGHKWQAGKR